MTEFKPRTSDFRSDQYDQTPTHVISSIFHLRQYFPKFAKVYSKFCQLLKEP